MATCRYADGTLQGVKLIWESWEVSASLTLPRIMPRKPYIITNYLLRRCNCLEDINEAKGLKHLKQGRGTVSKYIMSLENGQFG